MWFAFRLLRSAGRGGGGGGRQTAGPPRGGGGKPAWIVFVVLALVWLPMFRWVAWADSAEGGGTYGGGAVAFAWIVFVLWGFGVAVAFMGMWRSWPSVEDIAESQRGSVVTRGGGLPEMEWGAQDGRVRRSEDGGGAGPRDWTPSGPGTPYH